MTKKPRNFSMVVLQCPEVRDLTSYERLFLGQPEHFHVAESVVRAVCPRRVDALEIALSVYDFHL